MDFEDLLEKYCLIEPILFGLALLIGLFWAPAAFFVALRCLLGSIFSWKKPLGWLEIVDFFTSGDNGDNPRNTSGIGQWSSQRNGFGRIVEFIFGTAYLLWGIMAIKIWASL